MSNQTTAKQKKTKKKINLPKKLKKFNNWQKQKINFKGLSPSTGRMPKIVQHKG